MAENRVGLWKTSTSYIIHSTSDFRLSDIWPRPFIFMDKSAAIGPIMALYGGNVRFCTIVGVIGIFHVNLVIYLFIRVFTILMIYYQLGSLTDNARRSI